MSTLNWLAVVVATLIPFATGFLWFGPVLGKAWMSASGMTEEKAQQGNMPMIFGGSAVLQFIMAFCLAMFLNTLEIGLTEGGFYGFLTGFGWIAPAMAVSGLFEQRSGKYMLIHGGYWTLTFTLMGLVLGGWR
ncbi:MAG: DUF1761 domain-containing protein [Gemmatimonadota bacterium]